MSTIPSTPQSVTLAVFGSLRSTNGKKGYNFGRLGKQLYKSTHRIKGWSLYPVGGGSYPAVCPSETDELTVELHEVDTETFGRIDRMEKSANYLSKTIDVAGVPATIYFMPADRFVGREKVASGDWV